MERDYHAEILVVEQAELRQDSPSLIRVREVQEDMKAVNIGDNGEWTILHSSHSQYLCCERGPIRKRKVLNV